MVYDVDLEPGIPIFEDSQSGRESAAIAILSERDFGSAREIVHGLGSYFSYEDWLNCRDGLKFGLAMAGVDVTGVRVALPRFLAWCQLTGAPAAEEALDSFAVYLLSLRVSPETAAFAVVRKREFDAHANKVEAFKLHADHEQWAAYRETRRRELAKTGPQIHDVTISPHDFVEWSECLGEETSENSLDIYAKLLLEFLIEEVESGDRGPA